MNIISAAEAKRYRRQHTVRFAYIPAAFLGLLLPSVLPAHLRQSG
jgi:hypothetical protein